MLSNLNILPITYFDTTQKVEGDWGRKFSSGVHLLIQIFFYLNFPIVTIDIYDAVINVHSKGLSNLLQWIMIIIPRMLIRDCLILDPGYY